MRPDTGSNTSIMAVGRTATVRTAHHPRRDAALIDRGLMVSTQLAGLDSEWDAV